MDENKTTQTAQKIADDAAALKDRASSAGKNMYAEANGLGGHARQLGQDVVDHANAHAEQLKGNAVDAYTSFREYGKQHPLTFLAVGFAAGFCYAVSRRAQ